MVKNHNIINEYLELDNKYKLTYDNYLILLQVGSFYEVYSIAENDTKLKSICELLNIVLTKKNKSISKISKSNPWMAGFPCVSLSKYLEILINNKFTIIVYNQYTDKNKIKRKLDKIYSIGTYISEKNISNDNLILSLYLEIIGSNLLCGISVIDLSTGNIKLLEFYIENNDYNKLIEDINKEFIIYNPKEIIFTCTNENVNSNVNSNKLFLFLKNKNTIFHYYNIINNEYYKINYQNLFLEKIYKNYTFGSLNSIEFLNLERYTYGTISLIVLLNFAYEHDNSIINNINIPEIVLNQNVLNLHNNALYQLNIISNETQYKYNSLFDIINKTKTAPGKRFLKKNLTNPIIDTTELNYRYSLIEKLRESNKFKLFENELENILDLEKYHKSLGINKLQPFQYGRLNISYKSCLKLIKLSNNIFNKFDYNILNKFAEYYDEYLYYFNIDKLELFNINNLINNKENYDIFNYNIIPEIDILYNQIKENKNSFNNLANELSILINNDKIEIKYTDRDGYYLCLTKIRANKLKKIVSEKGIFTDLIFENKTQSNTYIISPDIKKLSKTIVKLEDELSTLIKNKYYETTSKLYNKYYKELKYLNDFISYVDFIISNTKISIIYNYNKPLIQENNTNSFMNCKNIRHPIIEQINTDFEYITNDISINYEKTGILLYGINGSGKSSIMKSIGLNIVLAQIGSYVAASEFYYYPYSNLFTRIDHSDNIFKGISSFESEILELKTILKFASNKSLVLGDEILNSTENISAISLISASINYLLQNNISFIFASHLHQIPNYINKTLKNKLNICHLQTDYDNKTQSFIYNRKLKEGMSIENYGLIVAKHILDNKYIIDSSLEIQNVLLNNNNKLLNTKRSKYNKDIYMNECYICNDQGLQHDNKIILDTHHIIFQQNFINNQCILDDKNHINKNTKYNLVNLCKYHHIETHNNNIIITGWKKTTNGSILDYKIIKKNYNE